MRTRQVYKNLSAVLANYQHQVLCRHFDYSRSLQKSLVITCLNKLESAIEFRPNEMKIFRLELLKHFNTASATIRGIQTCVFNFVGWVESWKRWSNPIHIEVSVKILLKQLGVFHCVQYTHFYCKKPIGL